jgi:hypothetical protein
VGLRVKVIFSKNHEDQVDEYFVPHNLKRRYLAQNLSDLTNIMIDQAPIVEGQIAEFIRKGSGYVISGIKSVKLEVTPFKPGIRRARGYIPLYPWLQRRRGIINIRKTKITSAFGNACIVRWYQMFIEIIPEMYR